MCSRDELRLRAMHHVHANRLCIWAHIHQRKVASRRCNRKRGEDCERTILYTAISAVHKIAKLYAPQLSEILERQCAKSRRNTQTLIYDCGLQLVFATGFMCQTVNMRITMGGIQHRRGVYDMSCEQNVSAI